jgi:F-type H+-transporting ATPase subunit b
MNTDLLWRSGSLLFRGRRGAGLRLAAVLAGGIVFLAPAALFAEGAEGGHGAAANAPLIKSTVWAIVSFLVVLFILVKKLLPPIIAAMDRRAVAIQGALDAAERARAERQTLIEGHEAEVHKARDETRSLIAEGKADAARVRDHIVVAARKEAEEIQARSRRDIEQAKVAAIEELERRAVGLAIDIAAKLIEKNLNPADHQTLLQERLGRLPSA